MYESLMKFIQLGDGWVTFSAIMLAIVFNAKVIYEFFEKLERRKINILSDAVKSVSSSGKTKDILQAQLDTYLFKHGTGIYAEQELREKIIETYNSAEGFLPFIYFRRARPMFNISNNTLCVEIGIWDKLSYYFNYILATFFSLMSVAIFMISTSPDVNTISGKLALIALCVFLMLVAAMSFSQTFPYYSAKKIQNFMSKKKDKETN